VDDPGPEFTVAPWWNYPEYVTMKSIDFKRPISELNSLGAQTVRIIFVPQGKLVFSNTNSDFSTYDEFVPSTTTLFCANVNNRMQISSDYQKSYAYQLKLFIKMIKLTKASDSVRIYPSPDGASPLRIEYEINGLGMFVNFYFPARLDEFEDE
jgi:hypothetical protein